MASHDQGVSSKLLYSITYHILCLSTPNYSLHVYLRRAPIKCQTEKNANRSTWKEEWITFLLKFLYTVSARFITEFTKSVPYFSMAVITSPENMYPAIKHAFTQITIQGKKQRTSHRTKKFKFFVTKKESELI